MRSSGNAGPATTEFGPLGLTFTGKDINIFVALRASWPLHKGQKVSRYVGGGGQGDLLSVMTHEKVAYKYPARQ